MGRTKEGVKKFRDAKNAEHEAKTHDFASLELMRPVRDVHGNKKERFFENEAQWSLKLHRLVSAEQGKQLVDIPESDRKIIADVSGRAPTRREVDVVRHVPVYEMCWEIAQVGSNGHAVILTIPYAEAYVREPRRVVELDGQVTVELPDGQTVQIGAVGAKERHLVPPAVAKLVRVELDRRARVEAEKKLDELEERMKLLEAKDAAVRARLAKDI